MFGIGVFLVILGAGSFILPLMGMQFKLVAFVEPYQPIPGIVAIVAGVALAFFGRGKKDKKKK